MPLTVWIASFAVALSAPTLWWALSSGEDISERATKNLQTIRSTNLRHEVLKRSSVERLALPFLRKVGVFGRRLTPAGWLDKIDQRLAAAGMLGRFGPDQVVGAKIMLSLAIGIWAVFQFVDTPTTANLVIGIGATTFGFFVPDLLLSSIGERRQQEIVRALPDLLDQMTISVEAGLGFEAAIARISERDESPLADEFQRMIQDIRLGVPRADALEQLSDRVSLDDLRHVVLALRQAEKLGVPLAKTLRLQAVELREKRKFRAEEQAYKLPVKMIFPLGMCILPALFIVILGPAVIQLRDTF